MVHLMQEVRQAAGELREELERYKSRCIYLQYLKQQNQIKSVSDNMK